VQKVPCSERGAGEERGQRTGPSICPPSRLRTATQWKCPHPRLSGLTGKQARSHLPPGCLPGIWLDPAGAGCLGPQRPLHLGGFVLSPPPAQAGVGGVVGDSRCQADSPFPPQVQWLLMGILDGRCSMARQWTGMRFCGVCPCLPPVAGSSFPPLVDGSSFLLEPSRGLGFGLPGHDGTRGNRVGLGPTLELGVRWNPQTSLSLPPHMNTSHWACCLPASGPLRPGQEAPPHLGQ
jgi:hypothetical protein